MSPEFFEDITQWLISRQTLMLQEDQEDAENEFPEPQAQVYPPRYHVFGSAPERLRRAEPPDLPPIEPQLEDLQWVGVNGRCNKVSDTCYTFWVGGSLAVSLT